MKHYFERHPNDLRRSEEVRSLARRLKMGYEHRDEYGLFQLVKDFQLFRRGYRRRIKHILTHKDPLLEYRTAIFDYQYTVHSNKKSRTYYQTVFFMESQQLALPQFLMKPETFFHEIGQFLGLTQDIDFTAFPEFSEKYLVQGEHPDLITDMMSEPLARFFTIEDTWRLEGIGYYLVFYQPEKRLNPASIQSFYQKGTKIVEWLQVQGNLNHLRR